MKQPPKGNSCRKSFQAPWLAVIRKDTALAGRQSYKRMSDTFLKYAGVMELVVFQRSERWVHHARAGSNPVTGTE